jgi:hypothetical protein
MALVIYCVAFKDFMWMDGNADLGKPINGKFCMVRGKGVIKRNV